MGMFVFLANYERWEGFLCAICISLHALWGSAFWEKSCTRFCRFQFASIYGLILLLAALKTGIVRLEQVKEVGNFLTGIFPLLFVPAAVGVMELWGELGEMIIPILLAIV